MSDSNKPESTDREVLVLLAMEAIMGEGEVAQSVLDVLRENGRTDIIEEAEDLLEDDEDDEDPPDDPEPEEMQ